MMLKAEKIYRPGDLQGIRESDAEEIARKELTEKLVAALIESGKIKFTTEKAIDEHLGVLTRIRARVLAYSPED